MSWTSEGTRSPQLRTWGQPRFVCAVHGRCNLQTQRSSCSRYSQNQFDSIDLSDNAIVKLEGFPRLLRLKQLLLNNNRISRIERRLEGARGGLERPALLQHGDG